MFTDTIYIEHPATAYTHLRRAYSHRQNPDGTTDSVCRKCFATVVTASRQTDLDHAEHSHCCDPKALDSWNDMIERSNRPSLHEHYDYE
ncbi:MAG TPA: hypothetical protein VGS10_20515 [Terracidiphilus sp.]|nr:hypothetical protein [Terracidiphilus sp.]